MAKPSQTKSDEKKICGIIMPISAMPPVYDAAHWKDVKGVFDTAIAQAGFIPQIVSDSFETDVIQSRIIHNLYSNQVIVSDIIGLNANVMFELGMRLTFNKPLIVVTDDLASIPFDTRIIEHLAYPRDLHIHQTQEFIGLLAEKIKVLSERFESGNYKTVLDSFGNFEVFRPTTNEVSGEKYIVDGIDAIMRRLSKIESDIRIDKTRNSRPELSYRRPRSNASITVKAKSKIAEDAIDAIMVGLNGVRSVTLSSDERTMMIAFEDKNLMEIANVTRSFESILGPAEVISIEVD